MHTKIRFCDYDNSAVIKFQLIPLFSFAITQTCSGGYFRRRSRICGRLVDSDLSRRMKNYFRFLVMIMNSKVDFTNNARAANGAEQCSGGAWRDLHAGEMARSNSFSFKRYITFEFSKSAIFGRADKLRGCRCLLIKKVNTNVRHFFFVRVP